MVLDMTQIINMKIVLTEFFYSYSIIDIIDQRITKIKNTINVRFLLYKFCFHHSLNALRHRSHKLLAIIWLY